MNVLQRAKEVFAAEIKELTHVAEQLDREFVEVVEAIYSHKGKVVITGIGKTGVVGKKIASSLASTGTPSIFINAAEAVHGDLGMVSRGDIVIAISNSGESEEIVNIIAPLKKLDCIIVGMTGNRTSSLAAQSNYVINVHVEKEASKIGLAPTSSTTAALVMGDALTVCLMEKRNFMPENFALYHPGGALGRRMLSKVSDCMVSEVPTVFVDAPFKDVVCEVSIHKLGITMVKDGGKFVGIITDGDIRRAVQKFDDFSLLKAGEIMSRNFKRICSGDMVNDALEMMDLYKITTLAVVEQIELDAPIIGILHIHNIYGFRR